MRIILTHEQADFDAVASMLGVYLLDDSNLPVLPRKLNRNVRAFITLYGIELPFVDARDLPNEAVEAITLVDTQSMVSVRGVGNDTQVQVIDHHPRRENLPANWTVTNPETGATTTVALRLLRETGSNLTPIQATLMLLGIYEDTGSLTYTRTTPEDLMAAAFLLENGANLQIAINFLNHPLTQAQQALYDQLRSRSTNFIINGHTVIISCADAGDQEEELSTIAHKLRDFLDTDALFVLVKTRGGIQLIARSTSDNIDVAAATSRFGGGGHERAAAALIHEGTLETVQKELETFLPEVIRPSVTVAQIMSRGPQLLTPDTKVDQADERMRRFGYEGYPVVETVEIEGVSLTRVVGLLTRRAVDRSLTHKLNQTVSSLMDKGEFQIGPNDSIETLQRLMIDSGWGQIPVVDPEKREIVGIVTRTDLLKILTPHPYLPERHSLVSKLEASLSDERLVLLKAIAQAAHELHLALYIVGGFVRDLILEQPSQDFDLVVEGEAIQLARSLAAKWGGRITSHSQFGTAKWHLEGSNFSSLHEGNHLLSIDLVSARTEFYTHPSALPTVELGSIKLDLHRRDFTINTLALRLDGRHYGEIHDYWGGLSDIRQGIVRVLHSLSFVDDPTRILRAVRFEQRLGFSIDTRSLELLVEAEHLIDHLSGVRIRHELDYILTGQVTVAIMRRLNDLHVFRYIHPLLTWDGWLETRFIRLPEEPPGEDWEIEEETHKGVFRRNLSYLLWLLRLEPDGAEEVCRRLAVSSRLTEQAAAACKLWRDLPLLEGAKPSQVVKRLEDVAPISRFVVFLACQDESQRHSIEAYAVRYRKVTPILNGNKLRQTGLPPGPVYSRILNSLRYAWLDGIVNTPEEEQNLYQRLILSTQDEVSRR